METGQKKLEYKQGSLITTESMSSLSSHNVKSDDDCVIQDNTSQNTSKYKRLNDFNKERSWLQQTLSNIDFRDDDKSRNQMSSVNSKMSTITVRKSNNIKYETKPSNL